MASGITHILLIKNLQSFLGGDLKMLCAAGRDFLQVGAVGPDLPYASIADNDFFITSESELADKFHYEKTNEIALAALKHIKNDSGKLNAKETRFYFCFFMGFISHIIADGVIHPFVRDKVGDYKNNQAAHRILEMQIDVLLMHHLTSNSGFPLEFNNTKMHDELKNIQYYPETNNLVELFSGLINRTYGEIYEPSTILGWVTGLHRMFGLAEGVPKFYRDLPIIGDFTFSDFDELYTRHDDILTLTEKKEGGANFSQRSKINFFTDVIPQFYKRFLPVINKAYSFVYEGGPELSDSDISGIDLDTGRLIVQNNLEYVPYYWS